MADEVRCVGCGYLAVREFHSWALVETPSEMREQWEVPDTPDGRRYLFPPICFARAFDLADEARPATAAQALTIINEPRPCTKSTPWRQGFTPKEHDEMLASERIAEIHERIRVSDKEWQATQAKIARRWQLICAAITAAAGLTGVLIGAAIKSQQGGRDEPPNEIQLPGPK